LKETEKKAALY